MSATTHHGLCTNKGLWTACSLGQDGRSGFPCIAFRIVYQTIIGDEIGSRVETAKDIEKRAKCSILNSTTGLHTPSSWQIGQFFPALIGMSHRKTESFIGRTTIRLAASHIDIAIAECAGHLVKGNRQCGQGLYGKFAMLHLKQKDTFLTNFSILCTTDANHTFGRGDTHTIGQWLR